MVGHVGELLGDARRSPGATKLTPFHETLKMALKEADIDPKNFTPAAVAGAISKAKNALIDGAIYQGPPNNDPAYHAIMRDPVHRWRSLLEDARAGST